VTPPGLLALLALAAASPTMTSPAPSQAQKEYHLGKAAGGGREARAHYQRGVDSARSVLATTADEPGALLWLAANLAGEALTHGKVFALGVIPEIESTLLRLEQTSPLYDHAAAARGLANLYWKAPALISVGSSTKAAAFFQQALARAPAFPGNQAMAAAFFADRGDCARARALAAAVDGRADLETFGPDAAEWRQLARAALHDCR